MESIFIVIVSLTSVYAQFDVRPKNTHVMRGDPVVLDCKATGVDLSGVFKGIQLWKEYYTDGTPRSIATDANIFPNYTEEFKIVPDTKYNLQLISGKSELKHAGKYECQNVFESNQNTFAEIIVIDSDPVCATIDPRNPEGIVYENDRVTYSCQIRYQGRWAPIQIWTDKDGNEISSDVGDDNVDGSIVHSYVSFPANLSDDGQQFSCQTKFGELTQNPPGENEDATMPSYNTVAAFTTLIVHYPPRNTQITDMNGNPIPQFSVIYPGEQIRCISTSNPPIDQILWRNEADNSTLGNSEVLVIQEGWIGMAAIQCLLRNIIGPFGNARIGEDSTGITLNVTSTTSRNGTSTDTIGPTTTVCPCPAVMQISGNSDTVNMTAVVVGATLSCIMVVMVLIFAVIIVKMHRPLVESPQCKAKGSIYNVVVPIENSHVEIIDTPLHEDTEPPLAGSRDSGNLSPVSTQTIPGNIADEPPLAGSRDSGYLSPVSTQTIPADIADETTPGDITDAEYEYVDTGCQLDVPNENSRVEINDKAPHTELSLQDDKDAGYVNLVSANKGQGHIAATRTHTYENK